MYKNRYYIREELRGQAVQTRYYYIEADSEEELTKLLSIARENEDYEEDDIQWDYCDSEEFEIYNIVPLETKD